jgi:hypothetical protein
MHRFLLALSVVLVSCSALFAQQEQAARPPGQPHNAWRYVRYNGRWWYWMPDDQWALYKGNRWGTFEPHSIGSSLAGEGKRRAVDPLSNADRSRFYNSLEANTRSILDSTRPQSPSPQPIGAMNSSGALGGAGRGTPGSGVNLSPPRSGDAGSGVGGGSVGGTSVTGGAVTTPPR